MNKFDIKLELSYRLEVLQELWLKFSGWKPELSQYEPTIHDYDISIKNFDLKIEPFFISTKKGVFGYKDGVLKRYSTQTCYGLITLPHEDSLLCVTSFPNKFSNISDFIIRINLKDNSHHIFSGPLRHQVHQIGWFNEQIVATETYHNSIVFIDKNGSVLKRWYPSGKALHRLKTENYKHFNSVYEYEGKLFIFAHNKALSVHYNKEWSSKKSEVYVLDTNGKVIDIKKVDALNGHNIYVSENLLMFCDSGGDNSLKVNNKSVFQNEGSYIRGLAINNENLLLGASAIGDRDVRENSDGLIHILDRNYEPMAILNIPEVGQIYDIRFYNNDLAQIARDV